MDWGGLAKKSRMLVRFALFDHGANTLQRRPYIKLEGAGGLVCIMVSVGE